MDRRSYLATVAAAAAGLAGCGSDTDLTDADGQATATDTPTPTVTPTPTPTATPTPEPVVDASVQDVSVEIVETEYRTHAYATGAIVNSGDPLLTLNALAKFYDAEDNLLNVARSQAMAVLTDEVWVPWIRYGGDGSAVDHATLAVNQASAVSAGVVSGGGDAFTIEEQQFERPTDANARPIISGTLLKTAETTTARVRAIAKCYDTDGRLLTTATDVVSDMAVDETWSFNMTVLIPPDRADAIDQVDILLYYR